MTILFATIGLLIGLYFSHNKVYNLGKASQEPRIEKLIKDKAKLMDERDTAKKQLQIATNKPSASDVANPIDIMQDD